jgi:pyrroloquinoline quinone biosynthesis protein D
MVPIVDTSKPRLAGKARLKWDDVRKKHLLLFPEGVLILNKSAQEVLALCDGQRTVVEIVNALATQYAVGVEALQGDVKGILQKLAEKTFVTLDD